MQWVDIGWNVHLIIDASLPWSAVYIDVDGTFEGISLVLFIVVVFLTCIQ